MQENKGKYYITTPIYYPSDKLHIGHTYCTVMADAMARFKRAMGYDVRFMTGADEHGLKIQNIAKEKGVEPKEYVDEIVDGIKKLWEKMDISYDFFIRTTDDYHVKRVQEIFQKMYDNGDIYKDEYKGLYCAPCESFWTEKQVTDGLCPDCGRPVDKAHEEAYFFRLSKYADRLLENFKENPDFLQPESRRNEMIAFIEAGLDDLCVSRSTFDWGIPVPIDESHVIYVWLDALSNYITALGYPDDPELYEKYWPADVHLVGKEIVRFHSIIWPAMLMSIDEPLPKQVLGHGWLLLGGGKMSKSKGNVVDPFVLIDRYGIDALKYFLLREFTFGSDGDFSTESMIRRINADLANDLGNLLSRTVSMIEKYCDGEIPEVGEVRAEDKDLRELAVSTADEVVAQMDEFKFNKALESIWKLVGRANKYIDENMPWLLAKNEKYKDRLDMIMHNLAESLRIVAVLIHPFMGETAVNIYRQLGIEADNFDWDSAKTFDVLDGEKVKKGEPLFPRIDIEKELEELEALKGGEAEEENIPLELKDEITMDDFEKLDLRVGLIEECRKHPKADKLLVFKVKMGTERRQIVSGVAEYYTPEEMVGKRVIVVANLAPIKLRGVQSNGMLLFADNEVDGKLRYEVVTTVADDGNPVT